MPNSITYTYIFVLYIMYYNWVKNKYFFIYSLSDHRAYRSVYGSSIFGNENTTNCSVFRNFFYYDLCWLLVIILFRPYFTLCTLRRFLNTLCSQVPQSKSLNFPHLLSWFTAYGYEYLLGFGLFYSLTLLYSFPLSPIS